MHVSLSELQVLVMDREACCCCCYVASVMSDLCDPIDGIPPGFPVPGILQARTLQWVAISFSKAWLAAIHGVAKSRTQLSDLTD